MVKQHEKFAERNAIVLAVQPGPKEEVEKFQSIIQSETAEQAMPFPILLDVDSKAVEALGIVAHRAKPSTYILDKTGQVRFAYVGATMSDRPSIQAMLDQLDALDSSTTGTAMP